MSIETILATIDAELAQLHQARTLLSGGGHGAGIKAKRGPGRPKRSGVKKKKRNISPEGRARIAAAVKKRWADQKKVAAK